MKKKQQHKPAPKVRTLKRPQRLLLAREWVPAYAGKKIVSAYAKKFRTDLPTAIVELRLLGVPISAAYEAAVRTTLAALAGKKKEKKETDANAHPESSTQNEQFAYIAGYTSGGVPYGLLWEELSAEERALYTADKKKKG